jgi:hypothetical protein
MKGTQRKRLDNVLQSSPVEARRRLAQSILGVRERERDSGGKKQRWERFADKKNDHLVKSLSGGQTCSRVMMPDLVMSKRRNMSRGCLMYVIIFI